MNTPIYGQEDATFRAAGGEDGIRRLVDTFYDLMAADSAYATIRNLHPNDLTVSRDKLSRFLSGWMGGPRRYREKYGPISIPKAHAHLPVSERERDEWLACMRAALARQPYEADLKAYLIEELAVPAEAVRRVSQASRVAAHQD